MANIGTMTMANEETPNAKTNTADNARSWGQAGDLARSDPEEIEKLNGRLGGGDSGGGAYTNPHSGKEGSGREGYMGHGGQTGMAYHGTNKLGEQDLGDNPNAPAENTGKDED